ncbi:MAG: transglycosylase SLT domain-containing protein, partial [Candidatus Sericytochromatia bacterium]|nr:transglycosylase SLT domain-containing protein [Candidatus Tanganyikabacteria bacterium]
RYEGDEALRPLPAVRESVAPPQPRIATVVPERQADIEQRLVSFIRWRNRRLNADGAHHIAVSLLKASAERGVDERLLACLVAVESSFDTRAVSRTGAAGLGQLLPSTARELGISDPHDVDQNLRGTATYLGRMLDSWSGRDDRTELALVSYLEGLGTVRKQVQAGKPLTPQQILFVNRVTGLYERI